MLFLIVCSSVSLISNHQIFNDQKVPELFPRTFSLSSSFFSSSSSIFPLVYLVFWEQDISILFQGRVITEEGSGSRNAFSLTGLHELKYYRRCFFAFILQLLLGSNKSLLFVQVARLLMSVAWGTCSPCVFIPACSRLCLPSIVCSCFTRVKKNQQKKRSL